MYISFIVKSNKKDLSPTGTYYGTINASIVCYELYLNFTYD